MIDNTNKNNRILLLLLEKIKLYRNNKISLSSIITDSEGLILSLDNLTEEIKDEFYNYWGVLEEIYAVNLDKKKELSKRDRKLIDQALSKIENMVKEYQNFRDQAS